jgi:hypothetical protein
MFTYVYAHAKKVHMLNFNDALMFQFLWMHLAALWHLAIAQIYVLVHLRLRHHLQILPSNAPTETWPLFKTFAQEHVHFLRRGHYS